VSRISSLAANLRSLPPAAWILFGGTFINRFGSVVVPFLILYLTRQGYTIPQAGLAIGMYGLGNLLAAAAGGWLADHFGRRNTIALSMFSSAASMLALSQVRGLWPTLLTACLAGLTTELYRPASAALLADLVPEGKRVTAFAVYRLAINLGFASGPAAAGFLAERSFLLLFVGDALTSCLFGIVALTALPPGLLAPPRDDGTGGWGEALRAVSHDRAFIRFLLASVCITLVDFQLGSTFALHVSAVGLPNTAYGLLLSLNGVLIVVFELFLTTLTEGRNPRRVLALGFLLAGVGVGFTGLSTTFFALAITVTIFTFGEMISSPVAGAYVADLAPQALRGRYMGLWGMTWSVGLMLGPPLGTLVFARSPAVLWAGCAVLGVLGAALVILERGGAGTRASETTSA